MNLLDCTFRDGGYYNNWDFSAEVVNAYVTAVNRSGLKNIEIGFRNFPDTEYRGAFFYSNDRYIKKLGFDKAINIFVMVDAAIFKGSESLEADVQKLFLRTNQTPVSGVRIATRLEDLDLSLDISEILNGLGYRVFLNLMQVASIPKELLKAAIKKLSITKVEVLYFADSLGEMTEADVTDLFEHAKRIWGRALGLHAHNNLGLAVANTVAAHSQGVSWLDATCAGMGRGAGNAEIENLLLEIPGLVTHPVFLARLALTYFEQLKKTYGWGASYLYAVAAKNGIHPTYVQELQQHSAYNSERVLDVIHYLSALDTRSYKKELITFGEETNCSFDGSWDAAGWCMNKEVLIIGAGESVENHLSGLQFYIETYKPLVISLSINLPIHNQHLVDYFACANESKLLSEGSRYVDSTKPILVSVGFFESVYSEQSSTRNFMDYGLTIKKDCFEFDKNGCVIPTESSLAYVLALCSVGGAKMVSLVGFDGFDAGDIEAQPMVRLFELYKEKSDIPISSLTPTKYDIQKGSLYSVIRS